MGLHEPARDRLRDTSGPWFRAGRLGAGEKLRGHPRGRRLGPLPLLQGSDATDLLQPSAAPLPRATGDGHARGGALPTLGQGHPRHALALRDRHDAGEISPHGHARCQGTPPGEDEPPAARPIHQSCQPASSRNICDAIGTTSLCSSTVRTSTATNYPAEQDIRIAVVNRKTCGGGNRTAKGAQAQSILMSVLQKLPSQRDPRDRHRHVNPSCSRQHPRPLGQPRAVNNYAQLWVGRSLARNARAASSAPGSNSRGARYHRHGRRSRAEFSRQSAHENGARAPRTSVRPPSPRARPERSVCFRRRGRLPARRQAARWRGRAVDISPRRRSGAVGMSRFDAALGYEADAPRGVSSSGRNILSTAWCSAESSRGTRSTTTTPHPSKSCATLGFNGAWSRPSSSTTRVTRPSVRSRARLYPYSVSRMA